jgi:hypothetical protein
MALEHGMPIELIPSVVSLTFLAICMLATDILVVERREG